MRPILLLALSLLMASCGSSYKLVKAEPVKVSKGTIQVVPSMTWNRTPYYPGGLNSQEGWTQNGLTLDQVWFFGGVDEGKSIAKQGKKADRQVPNFKADMLPQDLVSLLEAYYRIVQQARVFESTSVKPVTVGGEPGIRAAFSYVADDEVRRNGNAVLVVKNNKLYGMVLQAAALHYYDSLLPEFDKIVASATIVK
jgi:hypothetical protein